MAQYSVLGSECGFISVHLATCQMCAWMNGPVDSYNTARPLILLFIAPSYLNYCPGIGIQYSIKEI